MRGTSQDLEMDLDGHLSARDEPGQATNSPSLVPSFQLQETNRH